MQTRDSRHGAGWVDRNEGMSCSKKQRRPPGGQYFMTLDNEAEVASSGRGNDV